MPEVEVVLEAGPKVISACSECGWYAGSGELICEHAHQAQLAADERFHKERDVEMAAQKKVWACQHCGTVYGTSDQAPHTTRCSVCDRRGRVVQMKLGEAQKKTG